MFITGDAPFLCTPSMAIAVHVAISFTVQGCRRAVRAFVSAFEFGSAIACRKT
jgi:hypothetical protein